ncbi:MAG: hypothetical protein LDL26_07360, partial [Caenispirillum bisanense]|nr:hypothetical protein [Caenispirillum bisanense]MCA1973351.1 hypothetical protein [Caenispirillum sp.]
MHDPNGGAERARQHWSTVARGLAAWLALAGLLLHAAIPVGFMPGRDADGRFAIVVCGPSGGLNSEAATRLADLRAALGVPG